MTDVFSQTHTALLESVPLPAGASITARNVDYELDGVALEGYLAVDESLEGPRPGVLLLHDWTGVGEYVQVRAQMLARLGYVAFAGDIYGAGVRPTGDDAAAIAGSYYSNRDLFQQRAAAGLAQLVSEPAVDQARVAAIGYCFGGSGALELGLSGASLAGVVSFHGRLRAASPEEAHQTRAKLLVLTGAADPVVPDDQVVEFENSLRFAPELDWQVVSYSGAKHAFTLPEEKDTGGHAGFQEAANRRSWMAMRNFFDEIFGD